MVRIRVDLEERRLVVGEVERTLSNFNIQYLRQIAGTAFGNAEAEAAVQELIDQQIIPFLRAAGREPNKASILTEIEEAFDAHLYDYTDPD